MRNLHLESNYFTENHIFAVLFPDILLNLTIDFPQVNRMLR